MTVLAAQLAAMTGQWRMRAFLVGLSMKETQGRASPSSMATRGGVVGAMNNHERRAFLLTGTRTAKVATVRPDGRPHVAPVGFVLDGDDLVFTTEERSVKGRNLIANPRLTVCVDVETPPFAYVIVEGVAQLSRDSEELRLWAGRIGARYVGADQADQLAELNGGPGNLLVRLTPAHVASESGIAE